MLLQLDANGVELRTLTRSPLARDLVQPFDIAIAPDGSVYISGIEKDQSDGPTDDYGFLLKLPPL
jgi:hypothetical protein